MGGHGVRGLARIRPFNPDSDLVRPGLECWLVRGDGVRHPTQVLEARPHKKLLLCRLRGFESLTTLEPWIRSEIEVPESTLPSLGDDEFYHYEMVGLQVRTVDGEEVGVIREVMDLPGGAVWAIDGRDAAGDPKEILIPLEGPFVKEVDLEGGVATIEPIPGLLD